MRLCGTGALALSQGLSSCPARPKSATGHGARLTVSATTGHSRSARKFFAGGSLNGRFPASSPKLSPARRGHKPPLVTDRLPAEHPCAMGAAGRGRNSF